MHNEIYADCTKLSMLLQPSPQARRFFLCNCAAILVFLIKVFIATWPTALEGIIWPLENNSRNEVTAIIRATLSYHSLLLDGATTSL